MSELIKAGGNINCVNSEFGENCKAFDGAEIINSTFKNNVSIGNNTNIVNCKIYNNIAINRRCYINDSVIGDFSYVGLNSIINFAQIGKYCSIARQVDIGGFNHDYKKITTMPEFRFNQLFNNLDRIIMDKEESLCQIGNDVWIAAGVHILHNVKIGDGAVIGAGAIVTKDVEPYSIVMGVPAKFYKKRFEQKYIDKLLKIQWWDWPKEIIQKHFDILVSENINDEVILKLEKIKKEEV